MKKPPSINLLILFTLLIGTILLVNTNLTLLPSRYSDGSPQALIISTEKPMFYRYGISEPGVNFFEFQLWETSGVNLYMVLLCLLYLIFITGFFTSKIIESYQKRGKT